MIENLLKLNCCFHALAKFQVSLTGRTRQQNSTVAASALFILIQMVIHSVSDFIKICLKSCYVSLSFFEALSQYTNFAIY